MEKRYETFTVLIASINRSIRRLKTEAMAEYGLKSPHVSCLYYLFKRPGMTAAELNLVDRTLVLALMDSVLPVVEEGPTEEEIAAILKSLTCFLIFALEKNGDHTAFAVFQHFLPHGEFINFPFFRIDFNNSSFV